MVHGTQVGKRKLDVTFARRELDERFRELGEHFFRFARERGERWAFSPVPKDLEKLIEEVAAVDERLQKEEEKVAAMKDDAAKR